MLGCEKEVIAEVLDGKGEMRENGAIID